MLLRVLKMLRAEGRGVGVVQTWEVLAEESLFATIETAVPARSLPKEKVPEEPRLGPGSVSISWRGDGAYFATACSAGPGDPPPDTP